MGIRWKHRFANFGRSYGLSGLYTDRGLDSELERAGVIWFLEGIWHKMPEDMGGL